MQVLRVRPKELALKIDFLLKHNILHELGGGNFREGLVLKILETDREKLKLLEKFLEKYPEITE